MEVVKYDIQKKYVQSANAVFHFMEEEKYLVDSLLRKALVPRYCEENIEFLGMKYEGKLIQSISVLQKCFCDIPLHKLLERFHVVPCDEKNPELTSEELEKITTENTHIDIYGCYAIAFSKEWAIKHNLQPIHYINPESSYKRELRATMDYLLSQNDVEDNLSYEMLNYKC